jgi:DNA polymerase III epsilon subunit-like protein
MTLINMNNNLLCAVDVETTGTVFGHHEIIQVAAVPLNHDFEPHPDYRFFYLNLAPDFPKRASKEATAKHGIKIEGLEDCVSQVRGAELFEEWFNNLDLPMGKRLTPLAHNGGFERGFLSHWLGQEAYDAIWQSHPRDSMLLALSINDVYCWHGRVHPFHTVSLISMCNRFGIPLDNAHDALADCLATAKLYAELMRFFC